MKPDPQPAASIRQQFAQARALGLRAREAAAFIGQSEGAALAAHVGLHEQALQAVPLHGNWLELLQSLQACGPLLALTRNDSVVHEKTGVYQKISANESIGLALGPDIDLRLFFDQWQAGFAVRETATSGAADRISLQFFDRYGVAVHKIFPTPQTDHMAWTQRVNRAVAPQRTVAFLPAAPRADARTAPDPNADAFLSAWGAMTDTHQFFPLLRQFGLARQASFWLAQGRYTHRVGTGAVRETLLEAAFDATPIMCFVGSPGCIQIHSGPIRQVEPLEHDGKSWLNVLDPGFSLHLREDLIENVWVVEKPSDNATVTSLELFDRQGELMAMFFGARKPGQPELMAWRQILAHLPVLDDQALAVQA
ncbi:ChuX/HutX family heme-like substrate-binding protein [Hydrogenophaga sp.]|uniref:hemin-degrading factor n=1 Tax=Hydrogenophaga sp. TaxID=1904254 RepID=UPI0019B685B1|nr:ChuX/HutX family heme-like substrate-binding protein [Hydrogenophaga sp.]MBD3892692.1 hemin-degrading factor [Hydrogenophaga sp.]